MSAYETILRETILREALLAAKNAAEKYHAQFDNKEPQHMNCGFSWVTVNFNRNKACEQNKEFIKHAKSALKGFGVKFDSAGNMVNLDGSWIKGNREPDVSDYGRPSYLGSTWEWNNPGNSHWQDMDAKYAGSKAFADVLRSYGIVASVGYRLD